MKRVSYSNDDGIFTHYGNFFLYNVQKTCMHWQYLISIMGGSVYKKKMKIMKILSLNLQMNTQQIFSIQGEEKRAVLLQKAMDWQKLLINRCKWSITCAQHLFHVSKWIFKGICMTLTHIHTHITFID